MANAVRARRTDSTNTDHASVAVNEPSKKSKFGDKQFAIATKTEFSNSDEVRQLSLPRRWLQFCCNPFTRRYRYRPVVKPGVTLIIVGCFGILFFIMAIILGKINMMHYPTCVVEYPSFTHEMDGEAEISLAWDFPWVVPGTPTCDPVEGCYRDDEVTIAPLMCEHLQRDDPENPNSSHFMKGNVKLYYRLNPFYQNHRRYVLSRNNYQLNGYAYDGRGESYYQIDPMNVCEPLQTLEDVVGQYGIIDENGQPLPGYPSVDNISKSWDEVILYPCGLQAFSVFNDTFSMEKYDLDGTGSSAPIPLYQKPELISAEPDLSLYQQVTEFDVPLDDEGKELVYQWLPDMFYDDESGNGVENAHFMNWMRLSATSDIHKLYGVLEENGGDTKLELPVKIKVRNRYNVTSWGGKKYLILTVGPSVGRATPANREVYLSIGGLSLLICIGFSVKYKLHPRKPGDTRFIGGRYNAGN